MARQREWTPADKKLIWTAQIGDLDDLADLEERAGTDRALIERLRLNRGPQNTPVTRAKSITLTSCRLFIARASKGDANRKDGVDDGSVVIGWLTDRAPRSR